MKKKISSHMTDFECSVCNCKEELRVISEVASKEGGLMNAKKVSVKINGREVPMIGFVQDFVAKTIIGMLSSLKDCEVNLGDYIEIKIVAENEGLRK